jgi:hypothetical protein
MYNVVIVNNKEQAMRYLNGLLAIIILLIIVVSLFVDLYLLILIPAVMFYWFVACVIRALVLYIIECFGRTQKQ